MKESLASSFSVDNQNISVGSGGSSSIHSNNNNVVDLTDTASQEETDPTREWQWWW